MSCGPGIVNVPHFGCCAPGVEGYGAITLFGSWCGFWPWSYRQANHPSPNTPDATEYQMMTGRLQFPGMSQTETFTILNRLGPQGTLPLPVYNKTRTGAWDILSVSPPILVGGTATQAVYQVIGRHPPNTTEPGTFTIEFTQPFAADVVVNDFIAHFATLQTFPRPSDFVNFPGRPAGFIAYPRNVYDLTSAGPAFREVLLDYSEGPFGEILQGIPQPSFGLHWIGAGSIDAFGSAFEYTPNFLPPCVNTMGLSKFNSTFAASDWVAIGGSPAIEVGQRWNFRQTLTRELACAVGNTYPLGIVDAPIQIGAPTYFISPVASGASRRETIYRYAVPPNIITGLGLTPSCF